MGRYVISELPRPTPYGHWELVSATCDGITVQAVQGTVPLELTKLNSGMRCAFTNRFVRYGTLQVIKRISDPGHTRGGPVVIKITCRDGQIARLRVPADAAQGRLSEPLVLTEPTTCQIREVETRAPPGIRVITHGAPRRVHIGDNEHLVVRIHDTYHLRQPRPSRPTKTREARPGQIVGCRPTGLLVGTANGCLQIPQPRA